MDDKPETKQEPTAFEKYQKLNAVNKTAAALFYNFNRTAIERSRPDDKAVMPPHPQDDPSWAGSEYARGLQQKYLSRFRELYEPVKAKAEQELQTQLQILTIASPEARDAAAMQCSRFLMEERNRIEQQLRDEIKAEQRQRFAERTQEIAAASAKQAELDKAQAEKMLAEARQKNADEQILRRLGLVP